MFGSERAYGTRLRQHRISTQMLDVESRFTHETDKAHLFGFGESNGLERNARV